MKHEPLRITPRALPYGTPAYVQNYSLAIRCAYWWLDRYPDRPALNVNWLALYVSKPDLARLLAALASGCEVEIGEASAESHQRREARRQRTT